MTDYRKLQSKNSIEEVWKHQKRALQLAGVSTSEVAALNAAINEIEDSHDTLPSRITITTDDVIASGKIRIDDSGSDYTYDGNEVNTNSSGVAYIPIRCTYSDGSIVEERNLEILNSGSTRQAKFEAVMDGNNVEYDLYKTTFSVLKNADDTAIDGAQVTFTDGNSLANPAVTDASGLTDIYLVDGDYSFTVSKTGYVTSTEADLEVDGATQTVTTKLVSDD